MVLGRQLPIFMCTYIHTYIYTYSLPKYSWVFCYPMHTFKWVTGYSSCPWLGRVPFLTHGSLLLGVSHVNANSFMFAQLSIMHHLCARKTCNSITRLDIELEHFHDLLLMYTFVCGFGSMMCTSWRQYAQESLHIYGTFDYFTTPKLYSFKYLRWLFISNPLV